MSFGVSGQEAREGLEEESSARCAQREAFRPFTRSLTASPGSSSRITFAWPSSSNRPASRFPALTTRNRGKGAGARFARLTSLCILVAWLVLAAAGCGGEEGKESSPTGPAERVTTSPPTETGGSSTTAGPSAPCAPEEPLRPATPPQPPPGPAPGPPAVPSSLVATEWEVLPTTRKVVALTFDCGANADGVPAILRTLERSDAPATFFLTGEWAEAFPELARTLGARYSVGNHTYSHQDLTTITHAAARAELRWGQRAIAATAGADPRPLFRFPYGARDASLIRLVNELGYGSIRWTVDTLGWQGREGGQTVESIRARVLGVLRPGAIVLMHVGAAPDGSTLDADALPSIIAGIRARGYRLVDVSAFIR